MMSSSLGFTLCTRPDRHKRPPRQDLNNKYGVLSDLCWSEEGGGRPSISNSTGNMRNHNRPLSVWCFCEVLKTQTHTRFFKEFEITSIWTETHELKSSCLTSCLWEFWEKNVMFWEKDCKTPYWMKGLVKKETLRRFRPVQNEAHHLFKMFGGLFRVLWSFTPVRLACCKNLMAERPNNVRWEETSDCSFTARHLW